MDDELPLENARLLPADRIQPDPGVVRYRFRLRAPDGREFTSGVLAVRSPAAPKQPDEPPRPEEPPQPEPVGPVPVPPAPEKAVIESQLVTAQGEPAANKRFRIVLPDGDAIEGRSDGEGRIKAHAAAEGEYTLILPDFEPRGASDV